MRILHVITEKPPTKSGFARFIQEISFLMKKDYNCTVDILSTQDVPVFKLNKIKISAIPLKIIFMNKNYDVINVHGNSPMFSEVSIILFKLFGKKVVYTYHCDAVPGANVKTKNVVNKIIEWVYNRFHQLILTLCDATVFTSRSYAEKRKDHTKRYSIIPLGVNQSFFNDQHKDKRPSIPRRFLFVGQLQPYKGVDILISAIMHFDNHLDIVGTGAMYSHYREMARGKERIRFHSKLNDAALKAMYLHSDFVVLPSISASEAFGLVILEGMASGCIPVTSDLPGVKDQAVATGFTFKRNDVDDLIRIIKEINQLSSEDIKKRSDASITKARNYTWNSCVRKLMNVYERILS